MELTKSKRASVEGLEMPHRSALHQLADVSVQISERVEELLLQEYEPEETTSSDQKALKLCRWALTTLGLRDSDQLGPVSIDLALAEHDRAKEEGESPEPDPVEPGETGEPGPKVQRDGLSLGFEGDIATVSLPFVLQMVQSKGQDGMLIVHTEEETVNVVFQDGWVVDASSNRSPVGTRLGDVLVDQLVLDAETLAGFLDDHRDRSGYLGTALLDEGMVSSEALTNALATQVQGVLHRVFEAKHARFGFFEGLPPSLDSRVRMQVSELLK